MCSLEVPARLQPHLRSVSRLGFGCLLLTDIVIYEAIRIRILLTVQLRYPWKIVLGDKCT